MRSIASIAVDRCGCRRLKLPRKTDHINPSVISVRNAPFIMSSQNTARNRGTGCPKNDLKKVLFYIDDIDFLESLVLKLPLTYIPFNRISHEYVLQVIKK